MAIQALDWMVINVFAVFASPWSVFFRRYVLEPGLRLLVAVPSKISPKLKRVSAGSFEAVLRSSEIPAAAPT